MMGRITTDYLARMGAFNNFFEMLYDAMQVSLPQSVLSKTGAFQWRGYRIDRYGELARSQYYCIIRAWEGVDPDVLVFAESYFYGGKPCFPFERKLDLSAKGFFQFGKSEQRACLIDFISAASEEALQWQKSTERANRVPAERLKGSNPGMNRKVEGVRSYGEVSAEFTQIFTLQNLLFGMLKAAIHDVVSPRKVDLRLNTQWRNWGFRGYRMRISLPDGSMPEGPIPYRWVIYHNNPAYLVFQTYDGKITEDIGSLNLKRITFFDLEEYQQREVIEDFVQRELKRL